MHPNIWWSPTSHEEQRASVPSTALDNKEKEFQGVIDTAVQSAASDEKLITIGIRPNTFSTPVVLNLSLLLPAILVFLPGMKDYVKDGFEILASLPEWYQYLLYIAISASFGIKGVGQAAKMFKKK